MARDEKKNIIIGAKDETKGAIKSAKSGLKSVGTTWQEVAKGMLAWNVFVQIGRAAKDFVLSTIDLFGKQEQALARLTAALKNQNEYTEANIKALTDQAKALQKVTTFGDEQIISAQAMLASFALTTDQIKEMTPRMLDLATMTAKVTGGQMDLEQAAKFVGMALGGQAGRLTQAGIRLDDYQKKSFQAASESERFNMLIEIFDQNAKGLAESVGKTASGAMERFGNKIGDVKEKIGEQLAPVIAEELIPALEELLPLVEGFAVALAKSTRGIIAFFKHAGDAVKIISGKWNPAMDEAIKKHKEMTKAIEGEQKALKDLNLGMLESARIKQRTEEAKTRITDEETKKRKKMAEELADYEYELAKAKYEKIVKEEDKAAEEIIKAHERIKESFKKNVVDSIIEGKEIIQSVIDELKRIILRLMIEECFDVVIDAAQEFGGTLQDWIGNIGADAQKGKPHKSNYENTMVHDAVESIPIVGSVVNDVVQGVLSWLGFEKGGVVPGPIGKPVPAIVHGGETIIPVGKPVPPAKPAGAEIHIHVGAFLGTPADALTFAKLIKKNIDTLDRREITV